MPAPNAQVGQGSSGRKRNTANNNNYNQMAQGALSDAMANIGGGNLPALDPAAVANYYAQLQTLQSTLTNTLAGLKAQRKGYRGEAMAQKADVRSQGRDAIVEGINASLERGMLGSSADTEGRVEGVAAIQTGVTDVNRQLYDALAQNRIQGSAAVLGFEQGAQGLAGQAIGQRMELQAQELQNALAIQAANMQARASQIQSNATIYAAQMAAQTARDIAQGQKALADNWTPATWYKQHGLPVPPEIKAQMRQGNNNTNGLTGGGQALGLGR